MRSTLTPRPVRIPPSEGFSMADRLRRYLSAYWLRPENALWMTLRSAALAETNWSGPALDACCGDGVFSFLHAGGEFDPVFDVYRGLGFEPQSVRPGGDIYDCAPEDYRPVVRLRPKATIEAGSDFKTSLLEKAARLKFYGRLLEHDHDQPFPLPDGSFQTIYCNAIYWMNHVAELLREFRRLLRPGGTLILQVKLDAMRSCTWDSHQAALGCEVLSILGGGRLDCWPSLADRTTWERRFFAAGLAIREVRPLVTRAHAMLWYAGLRPIAPLLMRMAAALTDQTRLAIKKDWVALFTSLMTPLCRHDFALTPAGEEPVEMQYVLSHPV